MGVNSRMSHSAKRIAKEPSSTLYALRFALCAMRFDLVLRKRFFLISQRESPKPMSRHIFAALIFVLALAGCAAPPPSHHSSVKMSAARNFRDLGGYATVDGQHIKEGLLYLWADDGVVTCLKAASGRVVWRERVPGSFYSSPVFIDNHLYCISKDGNVVVLAATSKFKLLSRVSLGEPVFATPAVSNGVMYLRTQSRLLSLGVVDHEKHE